MSKTCGAAQAMTSSTPPSPALTPARITSAAGLEMTRFSEGSETTPSTETPATTLSPAVSDQDLIDGGANNDIIIGGSGSDWCYGDDGDDYLSTTDASCLDVIDGGSGYDTASYDRSWVFGNDRVLNCERLLPYGQASMLPNLTL